MAELPSGGFLYNLVKALVPDVVVEDFHVSPTRPLEKMQNLNALCLAVRKARKSFPPVSVQDVVMGRANASLDLMWDLAYAFEIEPCSHVATATTGAAAVIAWTQHRVASCSAERELPVTDLTSRCASLVRSLDARC